MKKHILITGASSGIGEGLALGYANTDVHLYITGRNAERLENVAEKCRARGAVVTAKAMDVTDRHAMAEWIATLPALDIVFANAGVSAGFAGQEMNRITDDYTVFDVNLYGVLNTIYPVLPAMMTQKTGHIVLISSLAGFIPMPSAPAYSASKVAVRFYGEALSAKLKPYGVGVSIVCPGFIKSRMTDANDFPMPFLMEADKAVAKIMKGVADKKLRIDFPLPMTLPLALLSRLPSGLLRFFMHLLPDKKPIGESR